MIKAQTVNTFEDGLIMDLEPLKVPKSSLTNALNATLLTFNDNENSLQCDMGNGRVETAYLPTGYIPMGTTSLGGIIYIVSYNPIEDKCQIGSFPSPERNITSSETSNDIITLSNSIFVDDNKNIIRTLYKKKLYDTNLNPGDKFLITVDENNTTEDDPYAQISYYDKDNNLQQKWLTFELATLDSNGRLIYLNDLLKYSDKSDRNFIFKIKDNNTSDTNVDAYRDVISADYNIFNAKISGKLYLVVQLDVPDKINITYKVVGKETIDNVYTYKIQIICTALPTTYTHPITYNYQIITSEAQSEVKSTTSEENKTTTTFNVNINTENSTEIEIKPSLEIGNCTWLDTTLHIDPTLINSGKVISEEWRYYKNETYMDTKFSLDLYPYEDETVSQVKVVFIPYTEIKYIVKEQISDSVIYENSNYYSITLPTSESYFGIQTINAIFNDKLKENSLYLVKIIVQKNKITNKITSYSSTIHFMYTNNMYNEAYLNYDQEGVGEKNFDNLELPITCEFKLSTDTDYTIIDNTEYPSFVLNTNDDIQGESKIQLSGNIDLKSNLILSNDYNTFSIESKDLQFDNVSSENIKTEILGESKQEINNLDIKEPYLDTELTVNSNTVIYNITIHNPIHATTELKTIQVTNYLTPIASTLSEFNNYDIYQNQEGALQYLPSFFGLGMSSGGTDNTGGGGVFNVKGIVDLDVQEDEDENDKQKLTQYAVSLYDNKNDNSGYNKFPDSTLSTAIDQMKNSSPIVPVLLTFVGGNFIRIPDKDSLWYTEQDSDTSGDRLTLFQWEQASTYRYIWFFLRTNYSSTQYVPLNTGIRIAPTEGTATIGGKTVKEYSYLDSMKVWINILTQLYVKKQNKKEITKYSVSKINYTKNLQLHISSSLSGQINSNETSIFTPTYYIGSDTTTTLNDIYDIYKYKCLEIKTIDTKISNFDINITKTIDDPLIEEFLKAQSSTPVVSTYINNPFKNKSITSVKSLQSSASQIYAINFETGELYIPEKEDSIEIKDIASFNENEITLKDDTFLKLTNLDLLYYDSRENNGDGRLLINKSQYDAYSKFNIYFSAGNHSTRSATLISSASISDDLKLF